MNHWNILTVPRYTPILECIPLDVETLVVVVAVGVAGDYMSMVLEGVCVEMVLRLNAAVHMAIWPIP